MVVYILASWPSTSGLTSSHFLSLPESVVEACGCLVPSIFSSVRASPLALRSVHYLCRFVIMESASRARCLVSYLSQTTPVIEKIGTPGVMGSALGLVDLLSIVGG